MNHAETVTELTMNRIEQMENELCTAYSKITVLEGTIDRLKWNADLYKNCDKRARFFRRLPTLHVYIMPYSPLCRNIFRMQISINYPKMKCFK